MSNVMSKRHICGYIFVLGSQFNGFAWEHDVFFDPATQDVVSVCPQCERDLRLQDLYDEDEYQARFGYLRKLYPHLLQTQDLLKQLVEASSSSTTTTASIEEWTKRNEDMLQRVVVKYTGGMKTHGK